MNGITEVFNKALGAHAGALFGDGGAGLLAGLANKPAKKELSGDGMVARDIVLSLADKLVNQEAEQQSILADIQGCAFTDGDIPLIVKTFKDKLDSEKYKGSAQRASDLKIVLLAMLKWGFVSGEGLQASAKQARELAKKRGYIKPRARKEKSEEGDGEFLGISAIPQKDTATPSDSGFLLHLEKAKEYVLAKFDWEEHPEAKKLCSMLLEVCGRAEKLIERV